MTSSGCKKRGTCKFFNSQKGYGFILQDEDPTDIKNKAEVFVHHTAIHNNGGFKSLAEGEIVEFDLIQGPKGLQAANVTGPNGRSVKGDPKRRATFAPSNNFGVTNSYPINSFSGMNGTYGNTVSYNSFIKPGFNSLGGGYSSGISISHQQPYHIPQAFAPLGHLTPRFSAAAAGGQYGSYGYLTTAQPNGNATNGATGTIGHGANPYTSATQGAFPQMFPQFTAGANNDTTRSGTHNSLTNGGGPVDTNKFGISATGGMFGNNYGMQR